MSGDRVGPLQCYGASNSFRSAPRFANYLAVGLAAVDRSLVHRARDRLRSMSTQANLRISNVGSNLVARTFVLVTGPIAPRVPRATLQGMQINIGVKRLILIRSSCSHLQDHCVSRGSVLQVVPVRDTGFEANAIAWAEKFFAVIRHQDHRTLEHVNKLVLFGVPMPLARPSSGREAQQVNSELRKPRGISQAPPGRPRHGASYGAGYRLPRAESAACLPLFFVAEKSPQCTRLVFPMGKTKYGDVPRFQ